MIISNSGQFLIATPTKCGTTTLEELARRHRGGRTPRFPDAMRSFAIMDAVDSDDNSRRQHRMCRPAGTLDFRMYMMIRHPYDRLVSIYEYMRNPANYSKWGAYQVQGNEWPGWTRDPSLMQPMTFTRFVIWYAECRDYYSSLLMQKRRGDLDSSRAYRSPWIWTDSLRDSWEIASPVRCLRLEYLWSDLAAVCRKHGVAMSLRQSIHANRSANRLHDNWREYWSQATYNAAFKDAVLSLELARESHFLGYDTTGLPG